MNDVSFNWCGVNLIKVLLLLCIVNEKFNFYVYVSFILWNIFFFIDMLLFILLFLLIECYRVSDFS